MKCFGVRRRHAWRLPAFGPIEAGQVPGRLSTLGLLEASLCTTRMELRRRSSRDDNGGTSLGSVNMRGIGVGIVGAGRISDLHAIEYLRSEDARIMAVCDRAAELVAGRGLNLVVELEPVAAAGAVKCRAGGGDRHGIRSAVRNHAPAFLAPLGLRPTRGEQSPPQSAARSGNSPASPASLAAHTPRSVIRPVTSGPGSRRRPSCRRASRRA